MKIASVADVKARFSSFLRESKEGPVIVTRNGKPVGVLLPMEDEEEIERLLLAYSPQLSKILASARYQIQTSGGISHKDLWKEMEGERPRIRKNKTSGRKSA
jgi:prevent-host-death family protein